MPCCKGSFIFEGTSVPAENACMYAAQDGLLSSDFTAEPFLKHFFQSQRIVNGTNCTQLRGGKIGIAEYV